MGGNGGQLVLSESLQHGQAGACIRLAEDHIKADQAYAVMIKQPHYQLRQLIALQGQRPICARLSSSMSTMTMLESGVFGRVRTMRAS